MKRKSIAKSIFIKFHIIPGNSVNFPRIFGWLYLFYKKPFVLFLFLKIKKGFKTPSSFWAAFSPAQSPARRPILPARSPRRSPARPLPPLSLRTGTHPSAPVPLSSSSLPSFVHHAQELPDSRRRSAVQSRVPSPDSRRRRRPVAAPRPAPSPIRLFPSSPRGNPEHASSRVNADLTSARVLPPRSSSSST